MSAKASSISLARIAGGSLSSGRLEAIGGDGFFEKIGERPLEVVSVALNHTRGRETLREQAAEAGVVFDEHESLARHALLDQRLGDRPGAWAKLDDEAFARAARGARHRACE